MKNEHTEKIEESVTKLKALGETAASPAAHGNFGHGIAIGVEASVEAAKIQVEFAKIQAENAASQDRYSRAIKRATWIIALATIAQVLIAIFKK